MMRPLLVDVMALVLPLAVGVVAFALGRFLARFPKFVLTLTVVLIGVGVVGIVGGAANVVNELLCAVGGTTVVLLWTALMVIGTAWTRRGNGGFSSGFLGLMITLAGCVLVVESSGRLWWRFVEPDLWNNFPDAEGRARQTSGLTCGPAVASMLLHAHGIDASEGEMAYLSGTSFFGSHLQHLARALNEKLEGRGRAEVRRSSYDELLARSRPFLAQINGPYLGHAVLVSSLTADEVLVFNPLGGESRRFRRAEFESICEGTVIEIDDQ